MAHWFTVITEFGLMLIGLTCAVVGLLLIGGGLLDMVHGDWSSIAVLVSGGWSFIFGRVVIRISPVRHASDQPRRET